MKHQTVHLDTKFYILDISLLAFGSVSFLKKAPSCSRYHFTACGGCKTETVVATHLVKHFQEFHSFMSTFFGLLQRSKCCRCALGTSYKAKAQPSGLGLRLYLYLLIGRHYKILAINILGWGLKRISIHPWLIIYLVFRAIFQSIKWLVYHFLHDVSADVLSSIYNSTSLLLDNMMTSVNWLVLLKIITLLFFLIMY